MEKYRQEKKNRPVVEAPVDDSLGEVGGKRCRLLRTFIRFSGYQGALRRTTSAKRTGNWSAIITPTRTTKTLEPRSALSRFNRPTKSNRTRRGARSTTSGSIPPLREVRVGHEQEEQV